MPTIANLAVRLSLQDEFTSKLGGVRSKLDSIGQGFMSVGTRLTAGVTAPMVAFAGYAVKSASDLNEAMDKTRVVFDNNAASVIKWSQNSSTAMGLSQAKALEYSSTLGNLFVSMGFTSDKAAKMSTDFVQLAVDMSSLNNVPVADTLNAIRSAIVGEYEPMRSLGVVINENTVKMEAMAMGLWDGTGAMDAQTKTLAIMSLIYDKTGTAQGNFHDTMNQTANQSRIARAVFDDLAATIGQILLPTVTDGISTFTDMARAFQQLPAPVQKTVVVLGLVAAVLGPLLISIGLMATGISAAIPVVMGLATAFGALAAAMWANPITIVIAAIVLAIAALYVAYQTNFLGFRTGVETALAAIGYALTIALAAWDQFKSGVVQKWGEVKAIVTMLGPNIISAVGDLSRTLHQKGLDLYAGLHDGILDKWATVKGWLSGTGGYMYSAVGDLSRAIRDRGWQAIDGLSDGVLDNWSVLKGWFGGLGGYIAGAVPDLSNILYSAGQDAIQGLIDGVGSMLGALESKINSAIGIFGRIPGLGNSPWPWYIDAAHDAMDGLMIGIRDKEGALGRSIDGVVDIFGGASPGLSAAMASAAAPTGGRGEVHHYHDNRRFYALKQDEYVELINDARDGGQFARGFGGGVAMKQGSF